MSNQVQSGGIGLSGAVFLVFLVLKLTDHIDWSWWWVTAPLWMPMGLVLAIVVLAIPIGLLWTARTVRHERRMRDEWRRQRGLL